MLPTEWLITFIPKPRYKPENPSHEYIYLTKLKKKANVIRLPNTSFKYKSYLLYLKLFGKNSFSLPKIVFD